MKINRSFTTAQKLSRAAVKRSNSERWDKAMQLLRRSVL